MRDPDLIIGPRSNPQTHRWHLWLPASLKKRGWQLALHRWFRSDDDRALHDHKAWSISLLLWGRYREWMSHAWQTPRYRVVFPFVPVFRRAEQPHRVSLINDRKVWSLWLRGPQKREWGFYCPKGWRIWYEYISSRDYMTPGSVSEIGKGCA